MSITVGIRKKSTVTVESERCFITHTATENSFKTVLITLVQQVVYKRLNKELYGEEENDENRRSSVNTARGL